MGIPVVYRKSSEGALANYDYNDIAEGTGIVIFYGIYSSKSTGSSTILVKNAMTSVPATIESGDVNFDLSPFNLPKIIGGTAYVTGDVFAVGNPYYIDVQFQKVSDGVETNFSSVVRSQTITTSAQFTFPITLTQTHFKKGDILRVNVILPTVASTGLYLATDSTSKPFRIMVPFRLDL